MTPPLRSLPFQYDYVAVQHEKIYADPYTAIDDLHAFFQEQLQRCRAEGAQEALCRLQLAVHEWVANLARHGQFKEQEPQVQVRLWQALGNWHCKIFDNSERFAFDAQLERQARALEASPVLPEGGMGLLLIGASTEFVNYTAEEDTNCLYLIVGFGRFGTGDGAGETFGEKGGRFFAPGSACPLPDLPEVTLQVSGAGGNDIL